MQLVSVVSTAPKEGSVMLVGRKGTGTQPLGVFVNETKGKRAEGRIKKRLADLQRQC
jgi:hypothetical protein